MRGRKGECVNSTRLFPFTALPHSHAGTHARTPPRAMCPCRSWMKNRRFTQRSMWSWLWCVVVVCCVLWIVPCIIPCIPRVRAARAARSLLSPHFLVFTGPALLLLLQAIYKGWAISLVCLPCHDVCRLGPGLRLSRRALGRSPRMPCAAPCTAPCAMPGATLCVSLCVMSCVMLLPVRLILASALAAFSLFS